MLRRLSLFTLALAALVNLTGCQKDAPLGSQGNPVKLYFTPSVDADTITQNSDEFVKFLEKETGLYFKTGIPASFVAVVEAFGSERADIGVMNSFGYILANQKYGAEAKLRVIRYGHDYYQGVILARTDRDIKEVKDLQGKKFAFTDPSSTSGYMFPKKMIQEAGVELGEHVFAGKHDSVVTMIYQGQVDAGAAYYSAPAEDGTIRDARSRVITQFPDVAEKVKIVAITDKIPNDPFVFRKGLSAEVTNKFIGAVKKYLETEEGKTVFKNIYSVDGLVDSSDADYEGLRKTLEAINVNPAELLNK